MSERQTVPSVPEGKYVDIGDGLELHLHDSPADEGVPHRGVVLFIHGSGPGASGYSNFNGNYPAFNAAGYRTLVPDMFGYGYSSKPTEGKFFMNDLAAQFVRMLDGLGIDEPVHLVGNSMGGAVCIQMALHHADRVGKLILMAPGGLEERDVYMNMVGIKTMIGNLMKSKGVVTREGLRETFKLQLHDESLITDEIIEERFQVSELQPKGLLSRLIVKNAAEDLGKIEQETICLWGVDDKFCPVSGAYKVAERVKGSRTVLINGCGHWVMVEYAKLFNETSVRFLDGELG